MVRLENHIRPPATVAAAMSGGVDSSVAAVLLKRQGYDVLGLTMRLWDATEDGQLRCCSSQSFADARAICHQWNIPHYIIDLRKPFEEKVIQLFIAEYLQGQTPNPCVVCNTQIKWGILLSKAQAMGAQALATGHYARVCLDEQAGRFLLLRGSDKKKDQSYALWGLSQEALSKTIFPLGSLTKEETRQMARQLDLKVSETPDSQEICFVPQDDYGTFLLSSFQKSSCQESPPWSPGVIVDRRGQSLGQHRGIPFYTVGQRRGLGLATGKPLYVLEIDPRHNRLVVGTNQELFTRRLWAQDMNWVSIPQSLDPLSCAVQIRYNHRAAPAILFPLPSGDVQVSFVQSQRAITPGQSMVFYHGEVLLGGGIIRRPYQRELVEAFQMQGASGKQGER